MCAQGGGNKQGVRVIEGVLGISVTYQQNILLQTWFLSVLSGSLLIKTTVTVVINR